MLRVFKHGSVAAGFRQVRSESLPVERQKNELLKMYNYKPRRVATKRGPYSPTAICPDTKRKVRVPFESRPAGRIPEDILQSALALQKLIALEEGRGRPRSRNLTDERGGEYIVGEPDKSLFLPKKKPVVGKEQSKRQLVAENSVNFRIAKEHEIALELVRVLKKSFGELATQARETRLARKLPTEAVVAKFDYDYRRVMHSAKVAKGILLRTTLEREAVGMHDALYRTSMKGVNRHCPLEETHQIIPFCSLRRRSFNRPRRLTTEKFLIPTSSKQKHVRPDKWSEKRTSHNEALDDMLTKKSEQPAEPVELDLELDEFHTACAYPKVCYFFLKSCNALD